MSAESISIEQPAASIVPGIEDAMAYFQDEPNDGRFYPDALKTAKEFLHSLDVAGIAEAIANQVPYEAWSKLYEDHPDVLSEVFINAIREAWEAAVDEMMLEGVSPERRKYLEGIRQKAKS